MPTQVKIDSLRRSPVPPAVTRRERHSNDSSPVPCGQPALLIVPSAAHRLVLFTLGDAALPGKAEDVGVAAEDGTMFHGSQHPYWVTRLMGEAEEGLKSWSCNTTFPIISWCDFICSRIIVWYKTKEPKISFSITASKVKNGFEISNLSPKSLGVAFDIKTLVPVLKVKSALKKKIYNRQSQTMGDISLS